MNNTTQLDFDREHGAELTRSVINLTYRFLYNHSLHMLWHSCNDLCKAYLVRLRLGLSNVRLTMGL
jgi:hypothetical protein